MHDRQRNEKAESVPRSGSDSLSSVYVHGRSLQLIAGYDNELAYTPFIPAITITCEWTAGGPGILQVSAGRSQRI